jgi:NlpC/P60 family
MTTWYNKYLNLPYKHLGNNPETGIDCVNLCSLVLKTEKNLDIPYKSFEFCNIVDDNWYLKTNEQFIENAMKADARWQPVTTPKVFDILTMSIGSTNVTNHCAIFVEPNKCLHIMIARPSWVSPFKGYYKQYTTGIYRWNTSN